MMQSWTVEEENQNNTQTKALVPTKLLLELWNYQFQYSTMLEQTFYKGGFQNQRCQASMEGSFWCSAHHLCKALGHA